MSKSKGVFATCIRPARPARVNQANFSRSQLVQRILFVHLYQIKLAQVSRCLLHIDESSFVSWEQPWAAGLHHEQPSSRKTEPTFVSWEPGWRATFAHAEPSSEASQAIQTRGLYPASTTGPQGQCRKRAPSVQQSYCRRLYLCRTLANGHSQQEARARLFEHDKSITLDSRLESRVLERSSSILLNSKTKHYVYKKTRNEKRKQ
jgi:hypothetical protein